METRASRRWAIGVAAVVAAGLAIVPWTLWRPAIPTRVASPARDAASTMPEAGTAAAPAARPRAPEPTLVPRPPPPDLRPSSGDDTPLPAGEGDAAQESTFAGAAAVARVIFDASPRGLPTAGRVYALPAGASGATSDDDVPHAEAPMGSREVLLPLPVAGRWDIGYVPQEHGVHAMARDVEVQGTTDVRLVSHDTAPIRIRVVTPGRPHAPAVVRAQAREATEYPGRDQTSSASVRVEIGSDSAYATPPLDPRIEYDLHARTPPATLLPDGLPGMRLVLSTDHARGGEEVEARWVAIGLVRCRLSLTTPIPEAQRRAWKADRFMTISTVGSQVSSSVGGTVLRADGRFHPPQIDLAPEAGTWDLALWLPGIASEDAPRRRIEIAAGATLDVEWRIDTSLLVRDPTPSTPPPSAFASDFVLRASRTESGVGHDLDAEFVREGKPEWSHVTGWGSGERWQSDVAFRRGVLRRPPDLTSEVFDGASRGEVVASLAQGGFLVLVPTRVPHPSVGGIRIRRTDGVPLPFAEGPGTDGDGPAWPRESEVAPVLVTGRVLGPLPARAIDLEVVLGGTVVQRLRPTVRAGVYTALEIPVSAGPGR